MTGLCPDKPSHAVDTKETTRAVDLAEHIDDRSARGIAAAVGRLITSGELPIGSRLPTVRELSRSLGVSPTTVSEAWQTLVAVGALDARGRRGTFVRQPTGPGSPVRYRRVAAPRDRRPATHLALDLSTGTPHPDLLPDLGPIIARVSRQSLTSSYLDSPVLPALDDALRGVVAVRPRGADRGRRRARRARPGPRRRRPPRRPRRRRAPDVPADARPARTPRRRGDRRRRRRPGHVRRRAARRARPRRARRRPPTAGAEPERRVDDRRGGPRALAGLLAPTTDGRRRGRPRRRHRQRPARQHRHPPAGADRAHPQLLQEPRPGPAPRRGRRRRRRSSPPWPTAGCSGPAGAAASCRRCSSRCSTTRPRPTPSTRRASSTPGAAPRSSTCCATRGVAITGTDGINVWMRVADERGALVGARRAGHRRRPRRAVPGAPRRRPPARHRRPGRPRPRRRRRQAGRRGRDAPRLRRPPASQTPVVTDVVSTCRRAWCGPS